MKIVSLRRNDVFWDFSSVSVVLLLCITAQASESTMVFVAIAVNSVRNLIASRFYHRNLIAVALTNYRSRYFFANNVTRCSQRYEQ
jgi:hypothetical protein